jgi:transposase
MPAHAVDLETKKQAQTWLMPPYSYSIRQIASQLEVSLATVQKWRQQLVDDGQELKSNRIEDNHFSAEQKFSAVIETALLSEYELAGYCRNTACMLIM